MLPRSYTRTMLPKALRVRRVFAHTYIVARTVENYCVPVHCCFAIVEYLYTHDDPFNYFVSHTISNDPMANMIINAGSVAMSSAIISYSQVWLVID